MKKWLAIIVSTVLSAVGASAAWESVDTWDMNDNGQFQLSDNGLSLGGHFASNNQQVVQVPDDSSFIFSPISTPQGFSGKMALSSSADLTKGLVRLSMSYSAMDWSTVATNNVQVGFRIWNSAETEYVGMAFADFSDKIFAFTKSSSGLGNLNKKQGRVVNSLGPDSTARTVYLELDYANSEVRMYAESWQWKNGYDVHTNAVDFAAAGITDIGMFQTYYQNWSAGDQTVFDQIVVEKEMDLAAVEGIYVVEKQTYENKNTTVTNTFASLSVTNGDYVVVQAAVNKATWDGDEIVFSGSAALGAEQYVSASGQGPTVNQWYVPVTSTGTVDVTLTTTDADNTKSFSIIGAYTVRSATGGIDILDSAWAGSTTNDTSLLGTVYTNVYDFGSVTSGLLLEAASSYMSDGNGISSDNPDYAVDKQDNGVQRLVGQISFTDLSAMTNIWTGTTNRQAVVLGIAFAAGTADNPTSLYDDWLGGFSVGGETGLDDDPDGDLLDNLTEYAFGGAPDNPTMNGNTPVQSQVTDGGTNYLEYIYFERDDAGDRGLASSLEVGTDLVITNWGTAGIEFVGSGASGIDGYTALTNRVSTDDGIKKFLRLQIEFTP